MTTSWGGDSPALPQPASEDLQGGGVFSVVVGLYDDLHVLIEVDKESQQALQAAPERSIDALQRLKPLLKTGL